MDIDRITRGTSAVLSVTFYGDEQPTNADNDVTVDVERENGTQVVVSEVATSVGSGTYEFVLPPEPEVTILTASWSGNFSGASTTIETYAEVVGGEFFTLRELRGSDSVLTNTTKYPTEKLRDARLAVEAEFEGICGRSFMPRYARERLVGNGDGELWVSNAQPFKVLSCSVNGEDWSDKEFTTPPYNLRVLGVSEGSWPRGSQVVIEYVYGMPHVPRRIKNAAIKRAKYSLVSNLSRIDERATVMNIPDFGNFVLATPGMRGSYTGIPEVDVVLQDYVLGGV